MVNFVARLFAVALAGLCVTLPPSASGQATNTTITTSSATQVGTTNSVYVWITETIGPGSITVGELSGCRLVGQPPFAGCNPEGGSGTIADPFAFSCSTPLALTGCTGGTPFQVLAGTINVNAHTQIVIAVATVSSAVPLGPWLPLASATAVLLAFALLRRRSNSST